VPTGAAGCAGMVPSSVPPRLSWSASEPYCFVDDPIVDGAGDLSFVSASSATTFVQVLFPSDGRAGVLVSDPFITAPRPQGFLGAVYSDASKTTSFFAVDPDAGGQRFLREESERWIGLSPDPRGGYVERRFRYECCAPADRGQVIRYFELRWVDADLTPRTDWFTVTTWAYSYNVEPLVVVDLLGNALVLMWFDPPMSMPCEGSDTRGFWVSESGAVSTFSPPTPTLPAPDCQAPNFAGFGSALAFDDGGVALFRQPGSSASSSLAGWYARYPSGAGPTMAQPAWLLDHDGSLQRLSNGAYLGTRRDAASCSRTAEIVGPQGQVCATLVLDGSDGCDASDRLSADGTLVLRASHSCSLRWWPGLGRSR